MEKKIPSVFANKVSGNIGNNEKVAYSALDTKETITESNTLNTLKEKNINQKINEIFSSSSYVYKADVEISLRSGKVVKRIVGKNSLYLITLDNELIPIADIVDIKKI